MRSRSLALVALLCLASSASAEPRPRVRDSGNSQPSVVGSISFSGLGASTWYGMPTPAIDCVADSSGGGMTCTGSVTATPHGSPATVATPFSTPAKAAALGGVSDYFTLGDVGDQTGSFTICAEYKVAVSDANERDLLSKWSVATGIHLLVFAFSGAVYVDIADEGWADTSKNLGSVSVGAWNVTCVAYEYVGAGTSIIRANHNGTAPSETTNAVGPPVNVATPMAIGARADGTLPFSGAIARMSIWTGTAGTAAQLAATVGDQMGLRATKPVGEFATFTRAATGECFQSSSAIYLLASGVPCINSSGVLLHPAGTNTLSQSELSGWTMQGPVAGEVDAAAENTGPAYAATAASAAPDGSDAILLTEGTGTSSLNGAYLYDTALNEATATLSCYVKAGTRSWIALSGDDTNYSYFNVSTCAVGTAAEGDTLSVESVGGSWCRVKLTRTAGNYVDLVFAESDTDRTYTADGTGTIYVWRCQHEAGALAQPPVATAGTPVAWPVTALSVPSRITNASRWAISETLSPVLWGSGTYAGGWTLGGSGNVPSSEFWTYSNSAQVVGAASTAIWNWSPSWVDGAEHTLMVELSGTTLRAFGDGVDLSAAMASGDPTALASVPVTLGIGDEANQMSGRVKKLIQCRRSGGCQ